MSATIHSLAQKQCATRPWQTHGRGQVHCLVPAFTWHKLDPLLRNQLISLACLYSTAVILTSLQDHENPYQVQSRREDGSHGSPQVSRKVLKNKEPGLRSWASSFELAGAQSTCEPLCAVKILLHFQYLCYKPEAGDIYRFNDSENKHNTSRHCQYLCPIPGLFSFQMPGLPLLWQSDNLNDSDTFLLNSFLLTASRKSTRNSKRIFGRHPPAASPPPPQPRNQ